MTAFVMVALVATVTMTYAIDRRLKQEERSRREALWMRVNARQVEASARAWGDAIHRFGIAAAEVSRAFEDLGKSLDRIKP